MNAVLIRKILFLSMLWTVAVGSVTADELGTAPKTDDSHIDSSSTKSGPSEGSSADPPSQGKDQTITVRVTYHIIDEQNIFYVAKLCHSLKKAGCTVVMMLDKEGTRVVDRNLPTQAILRKESRAHTVPEVIRGLLDDGIRVVVWADVAEDYGIGQQNAISGVEMLSTEEIARQLMASNKILNYSMPSVRPR